MLSYLRWLWVSDSFITVQPGTAKQGEWNDSIALRADDMAKVACKSEHEKDKTIKIPILIVRTRLVNERKHLGL